MMISIINTIKLLLSTMEGHHNPNAKIKIFDQAIKELEGAVHIIQCQWVTKAERLERALEKKKEIESEISLYENKRPENEKNNEISELKQLVVNLELELEKWENHSCVWHDDDKPYIMGGD